MAPADVRTSVEATSRFTILLIAYEFPPSPSPQSLRWAYLTRELALLGHRIHVLAPEHPGSGEGLPLIPRDIVVHRTFAGPGMGMLNALAKRARRRASTPGLQTPVDAIPPAPDGEGTRPRPSDPVQFNWKGRLHNAFNHYKTRALHGLQRLTSTWFFPDGRAEWYPWAKRRLDHLLEQLDVDLVISSHEPATTLSLGLAAHRRGYPWIVDLADPVLAPYTAPRWRRRARRVEREVCIGADLVVVTNPAVADLLAQRHDLRDDKLVVLTQGFDGRVQSSLGIPGSAGSPLELLYTGSFYSFRRAGPLLDAVLETPGVRLNIASISVPEDVRAASRRSPSIRLLGFLPHTEAVAWQRRCDVLVNLANDDPCQVPGKFYEYLGAGRPILHIGDGDDAAADLLLQIPRGWVCRADPDELGRTLRQLGADARAGKLAASLDLSSEVVRNHDWTAIAGRLDEKMITLLAERGT